MIHIADILKEYAEALTYGDHAPHPSHIATDLNVVSAAMRRNHLPKGTDVWARMLRRELLLCIHGGGHWATECTPDCREGNPA